MSGKLVLDNLYALIFGKMSIGKVNLNNLSNLALFRTARDMAFENAGSLPKLSKEQKNFSEKLTCRKYPRINIRRRFQRAEGRE